MNDTRVILETWVKDDLPSVSLTSTPAAWLGIALVTLFAASAFFMSKKTTTSSNNIPLINPPRFYDLGAIRAKLAFVFGARRLLALGVRTGRPFRLLTDLGEMIVLPARYAHEIRSDPRLSFSEVIEQVCSIRSNHEQSPRAHRLTGCWSRLCRISMRVFQALRVSARAPQMRISAEMLQTTSSRILLVGACPTPTYRRLVSSLIDFAMTSQSY